MPARTFNPFEETVRDQRTMVGYAVHATAAEVRIGWENWARERGLAVRRRAGDLSADLRKRPERVVAYVSDNCWTSDCPICNNGMPTWPEGNPEACCLDCGHIFDVDYPAGAELGEIVEALEARPARNRHFRPQDGETAETLRLENVQHGYHPRRKLLEQDVSRDEPVELALSPKQKRDLATLVGADNLAALRAAGIEI